MSTKDLHENYRESVGHGLGKRSTSTINLREYDSLAEEFDAAIEPVNYREKYGELTKAVQNLYEDFKPFVKNEDMGDSLRKLLNEEKDNDPLILIKFMKHTIKAINRFREDNAARPKPKVEEESRSDAEAEGEEINEARLEALLQKAENDIRQHIRIEHQLKIFIESLQSKYDDLEKEEKTSSAAAKAQIKELKVDNAKLAEIVKNKESEIANLINQLKNNEEKIGRSESAGGNTNLKLKSQNTASKISLREADDMKRYYESELATLNKQSHHIQKVLTMNVSPDEKMRLLQTELQSVKDFNLKKMHVVENRLKLITDGQPLGPDRQLDESPNENLDPKLQSLGFREFNETGQRPSSALSGHKQGQNIYDSQKSATLGHSKQRSQTQLEKILSDKRKDSEKDGEKGANSLKHSLDSQRKTNNSSQLKDQKEPNLDLYFKQVSNRLEMISQGTDREKEKEPYVRSFDNRTQISSRTSANANSVRGKQSRNGSVEKMRYDSLANQQRLNEEARMMSSERTGLTRKKGSQSNLRGSATSNFAITRKASHSQLQKYKF